MQIRPIRYLVESADCTGTPSGRLHVPIGAISEEIVELDRSVLQKELLTVGTDETREEEEASKVDREDKLSHLETALKHDQFVLAIGDLVLKADRDGRHSSLVVHLGDLELVAQVL